MDQDLPQFRLNVDTLNNISFDRSVRWGSFFNKYTNLREENDILLKKIPEYYICEENEAEEEEDDESDSTENADMEIDIDSMLDMTNKSECTTQKITEADEDDLEDVFNATLPVLAEHKRQCKKAGIDRILNTFDPEKIEKKVGGWLRRNQSGIFGGNSTVLSCVSYSTPAAFARREFSKLPCIESESDSESLHSFDTARYIQDSKRKRNILGRRVSPRCKLNTIKTYRALQSKRDALREKYAVDDKNDDEMLLKKIRCRRRCSHPQNSFQAKLDNFEVSPDDRHLQISRRKLMQKRLMKRSRVGTSTNLGNTSDTDDSIKSERRNRVVRRLNDCKGVREDKRCRSLAYVRKLHRLRLHQSISSSSSFFSTHSFEQMGNRCQRLKQRDNRPIKRESECHCCNDRKLCQLSRHLVSSSNDEWMVDNCDSLNKIKHTSVRDIYEPNSNEVFLSAFNEVLPMKRAKKSVNIDSSKKMDAKKGIKQLKNIPKKKDKCEKSVGSKLMKINSATKEDSKAKKTKKASTKQSSKTNKHKVCAQVTEVSIVGDSTFEEYVQIATQLSKETQERRTENQTSIQPPSMQLAKIQEECSEDNSRSDDSSKNSQKDIINGELYPKQRQKSLKARNLQKLNEQRVQNVDGNEMRLTRSQRVRNAMPLNDDISIKNNVAIKREEKTNKAKNTRKKKDNTKAKQKNSNQVVTDSYQCEPAIKEVLKTDIQQIEQHRQTDEECYDDQTAAEMLLKIHEVNSERKMNATANQENDSTKNIDDDMMKCWINEDLTLAPEILLKPQPKSAKLRKLQKLAGQRVHVGHDNESIFIRFHNFCNSTALADEPAIKRQIDETITTSSRDFRTKRVLLNAINEKIGSSNLSSSSEANKKEKDEDCTVVSSTIADQHSQDITADNDVRILLYTPAQRDSVPANSIIDDHFVITKDHLTSAIGERSAQKFMKYYVGRRQFSSQSRIYFRPPTDGLKILEYSDDSDVDALDIIDKCGELYESFDKKID